MILMCSGGGWWFRWRHNSFSNSTPTPHRRRRRVDARGRHGRVYPHQGHQYPAHAAYSLPDDVDKGNYSHLGSINRGKMFFMRMSYTFDNIW